MGITYDTTKTGWDGGTNASTSLTGSFDTSYTAGGEPLTPGDAGMSSIEYVDVVTNVTESGYVPSWDGDTGTIKLFQESGTTTPPLGEVPDTTDVSAESVDIRVIGRS